VVECTIHTYSGAEYISRGKVTADERKKNSPTGSNPQEMAEKRALARTLRLAFGQSAFLDEDDADQEDAERNDREKQQHLAQRYTEIFSDEEDEPATAQPVKAAEIVEQAHAAAAQRDQALTEAEMRQDELRKIDRQRREEGLI